MFQSTNVVELLRFVNLVVSPASSAFVLLQLFFYFWIDVVFFDCIGAAVPMSIQGAFLALLSAITNQHNGQQ